MSGRGILIGVDVGSGGSKVSLVDVDGVLWAEGRCSHPSSHARPGWVEQNPEDWVRSATTALREALGALDPACRGDVCGISFSGPHHVAVLLNRSLEPVRPAIMWNDQRSHAQSVALQNSEGVRIRAITGNSPAPTWTLPQLMWLRTHEPAALQTTRHIVYLKDYVRYRLTGVLKTDRVEAQGTLYFDVHQGRWAEELFAETGLDPVVLPEVDEPHSSAGTLLPEVCADLGLPSKVPVITGSADSVTEILAAGVVRLGDVSAKLATAGNVVAVADHLPADRRFLVYEHLVPGRFYWNSATSAAAASLRWFAERLHAAGEATGERFAEIDEGIQNVPVGADGLLFLPFLNGERSPHWDPRLRGSFFGLTSAHDRRHLGRAVMEGVAFSLGEAAAVHAVPLPTTVPLIGGGARSRVWPQIVADVLGRDVALAPHGDSSYGTALVAGVGIGALSDYESAGRLAAGDARVIPMDPRAHERYRDLSAIYRDLTSATTDIAHRLGAFAVDDLAPRTPQEMT